MPVALNDFIRNLEDSGIVSPSKLSHFLPPQAQPKDSQELAKQLVRSKTLTKYQAQEIYLGRARQLILGSYTIQDKIGAGGMGQVFKAQHRRMERVVAIKVLPAAMTKDGAAVARFEREVKAAAKLEHPNIVIAYDSDEADGVYFLVMQFVDGSDLSALVKKAGPLPVERAVDYMLQAARGLAYAHEQGVIHRDIKPGNMLVDGKGTLRILDMGLARLENTVGADAATAAELTASGTIMGTVDYMAPEQALNTKQADARSDIYSLGCTLHYLLLGKAPYAGETLMEKLLAHREQPIPDLSEAVGAPEELQAIFEHMLAKEPAERFAAMAEVVTALELLRGQLSTPSAQPGAVSSGPSSVLTFLREVSLAPRTTLRTNPNAAGTRIGSKGRPSKAGTAKGAQRGGRLKIALVAGALGLAALGGLLFWQPWKSVPGNPVATAAGGNTTVAAKGVDSAKPAGPPLDSLDPVEIPEDQRFDWQPKELVAVTGKRWGAHGPGFYNGLPNQDVIFTPDGSQLISCTHALHGLMVWDAKTLLPVKSFAGPQGTLSQLTITPDGKTLAVNGNNFWNLTEDLPSVQGSPHGYGRSDFDATGKRLALVWGSQFKLVELAKEGLSEVGAWSSPDGKNLREVKYFPDGQRVAALDETGQLYLLDPTASPLALVGQCAVHDGRGTHTIAVSSDGKRLASSGDDKGVRLWDVQAAGLKLREELPLVARPLALAFAMHDSRLLAAPFEYVRVWDLEGARAKKLTDIVNDGAINMSVAKEGTTLATIGGWQMVRLWDLSKPDAPELYPPVGHQGPVIRVAFSPDGRRLASGGFGDAIRIWDLSGTAPREEKVLPGEKSELRSLRFAPDGKLLAALHSSGTYLWDSTAKEPDALRVDGMHGDPMACRFDAQNRLAAVVTFDWPRGMRVFKVGDGQVSKHELPTTPTDMVAIQDSPDGTLLACARRDLVQLWRIDGEEPEELGQFNVGEAQCGFSADSRVVAVVGQEQLNVWDVASAKGPARVTLSAPQWKWTAVACAAGGRLVFAADYYGRVVGWNVAARRRITRPGRKDLSDPLLWQLPGMVRDLVVSPDGRYLASANSDGSVYILRIEAMVDSAAEAQP